VKLADRFAAVVVLANVVTIFVVLVEPHPVVSGLIGGLYAHFAMRILTGR
jgi:hypothetical protein